VSATASGPNDGTQTSYTLDPAGNRTNVTTVGAPVTFAVLLGGKIKIITGKRMN
jgi:hypothetical protein